MHGKILHLAVPNIISNLSVPLVGIADLAMLGRLNSEKYIGALSLGTVIFSFLYWMFTFLRMGTSGITAQAYGERNLKKTYRIGLRASVVAVFFSVVLIGLQELISFVSFILLDGSEEVESLAFEYFNIRIYAAPATLLLYVISGWFIGMQNARYPMYVTIVVNMANVAFNYIFIFHYQMHVSGVALGTVIAQYIGLVMALALFVYKYRKIAYKLRLKEIFMRSELVKFMVVNKDFFFRTLFIIGTIASFTNISAKQGDTILAVNSILLQFFYIFSFFADGFAYAAESLTGRYIGAQNRESLKALFYKIFLWGFLIAIATSTFFHYSGDWVLRSLTDDQQIISLANEYLIWCVLIPVISFASFIWDGIYIGATASKALMYSTMVAFGAVYLPIVLYGYEGDNHRLWLGFCGFLLARGVYQTLFFKRLLRFG